MDFIDTPPVVHVQNLVLDLGRKGGHGIGDESLRGQLPFDFEPEVALQEVEKPGESWVELLAVNTGQANDDLTVLEIEPREGTHVSGQEPVQIPVICVNLPFKVLLTGPVWDRNSGEHNSAKYSR